LTETGLHVIDLGLCATPLLYFSLFHLPVDGGIMITGSHNAAEYNGFKLCIGKEALHGSDIQYLRQLYERGEFPAGQAVSKNEPLYPNINGSLNNISPMCLRVTGCMW
jgi:phosphomannomutase / phosphoglucomutase